MKFVVVANTNYSTISLQVTLLVSEARVRRVEPILAGRPSQPP